MIADAYNIPNLRLVFEPDPDDIAMTQIFSLEQALEAVRNRTVKNRESFQYMDYCLSCRQQTSLPLPLTDTRYNADELQKTVTAEWSKPDYTMWTLRQNIPFK